MENSRHSDGLFKRERLQAEALVLSDLGSPRLYQLASDNRHIYREVQAEYSELSNLINAQNLFSKIAEHGVNVVKHQFIELDQGSDTGPYIKAERLTGRPLVKAVVERAPLALNETLNLINGLAGYYQEILNKGGIFPADFYESQFFFGLSAEDKQAKAYVVDLSPYVYEFDPIHPKADAGEDILSQTDALINLLLMAEGVSNPRPAVRQRLAGLYRQLAAVFPESKTYALNVVNVIDYRSAAEIKLALQSSSSPSSYYQEGTKPVDDIFSLKLPDYLADEQNLDAYTKLLGDMERAGIIKNNISYRDKHAFQEKIAGQPLALAWLKTADAGPATDEFVGRLAKWLETIHQQGGDYPVNIWSHRLIYGHDRFSKQNHIYLADPKPLYAALEPGNPNSQRRFAAFCSELAGIIIDAESSSDLRLDSARYQTEQLLKSITRDNAELNHKAKTVLGLLEQNHRAPIAYWMS